MLTALFERTWWSNRLTVLAACLSPVASLFGWVVGIRRALYRHGAFGQFDPGVAVVVVGNIVVGGAGKTPVTQAVLRCLIRAGFTPGVICRGYPVSPTLPRHVSAHSRASEVGDEPLLHFALGVPVVVCARRTLAASALLKQHANVDVLVADDALQHYALARDVEIEVMSGESQYGNAKLLPAGPLREAVSRARECDLRIETCWRLPEAGISASEHQVALRCLTDAYALMDPARRAPLSAFVASAPALVAGIAHPEQFARALERAGVSGPLFAFPDHHDFRVRDFEPLGQRPILMTEKDAAKCREFGDDRMWVVPMTVELSPHTQSQILQLVTRARNKHASRHFQ